MGEPNLGTLEKICPGKDEVDHMEEYWDRFVTTGKIEDYLYYKGRCVSVRETMNRYKEGDTIGKSDYTDWHDTDSSTNG